MINRRLVKRLISLGEKGYITYDELNDALGDSLIDTELYEEVMDFLQERGIKLVETEKFRRRERRNFWYPPTTFCRAPRMETR
jgi:RNA polymerase primary sigma factor